MATNKEKNSRDFDSPMGMPEAQKTPPPSYEMAYPPVYPTLEKQDEPIPSGQPSAPTQVPVGSAAEGVNTQQVHTLVVASFGPDPIRIQCPSCREFVESKVERKPGRVAYLWSLVLCFLCWPLVCVPCCIDSCLDAQHTCPKCGAFLGVLKA